MESKEVLLYGVVKDNVIFAREELVNEIVKKRKAMSVSKTWAEYIDLTSEEDFHGLIREILELLGHEELYNQYLAGEDLSNYVEGLYLPLPDDEFTTEIFPEDHLPLLSQEIITLIPDTLLDEMGQFIRDEENDFYYKIEAENEEKAVASFLLLGYECRREQDLIELAEGV